MRPNRRNKQEGIIVNGMSSEASRLMNSLMNLYISSGKAVSMAQTYSWATLKGKQNHM